MTSSSLMTSSLLNPEDVQCALAYLSSERSLALQFDKSKDDSLRDLVYGLLESMHVSLNEWNEERNQRKEIGEISTQTELNNPSPIIPIEPKEEPVDILQSLSQDYEISASELMRDEKMIMKEEMDNQYSDPNSPDSLDGISTAPDFARTLLPFNPREEPRDEAVSGNNQMSSLLVPPPSTFPPQEAVSIDFVHPSENMSTMGNFTPSNPKMKKEELMETQEVHNDNEIESMEEDQNENEMQPSEFMDNQMNFDDEILFLANTSNEVSMSANKMDESRQPQDTDSVKMEKRKRSSRRASRPMQYTDSMDDADDNGGPSMKKWRSDSSRKDDNKRNSIKGEEKSGYVSKKPNVSKENATELECPECEAGLALLCECGHESLSDKHSLKCNHGNTTVIRKRDCPIGRLDDEKTTPQCVLCEVYPRTARGYCDHLHIHHKSTLVQNGIYLMCSCGIEVRSHRSPTHLNECNPRQFTLHKLDDE